MKILVLIAQVPDTTSRIAFKDNNSAFDGNGVTWIVNPYDEWYALVRGLELKEAQGGTVTTVTVGGVDNEATIRKALAIGADDAVRIDAQPNDAFEVRDVMGRTVLRFTGPVADVSGLAKGQYLLMASSGATRVSRAIVLKE